MSRRQKSDRPPARKRVEVSDLAAVDEARIFDDDYDAVDEISDSDAEDEPDVEEAEEKFWQQSAEERKGTPQPFANEDYNGESAVADADEDDVFLDLDYFDEGFAQMTEHVDCSNDHIPDFCFEEGEDVDIPIKQKTSRKVHFRQAQASDSENDSSVEFFPDIFMEENKLHAGFLKALGREPNLDDDDNNSDNSFWDFDENDDTEAETPQAGHVEDQDASSSSDDDESSDASGYESDEGETTDEDIPVLSQKGTASVLRRNSNESSASEDIPTIRRTSIQAPKGSKGPRLGTWYADPRKAFATIDKRNKIWKIKVVRAKADHRRFSFPGIDATTPHNGQYSSIHELLSNSGNIMMGGMPYGSLAGNEFGPPETFYPYVEVGPNGIIHRGESPESMSSDEYSFDGDDFTLADFLNVGSSDEEEDEVEEEDNSSDSPLVPSSTPARPLTSEDQVHPLLSRLQGPMVGAFRKNQTRHTMLSRNEATSDSLLFSGPTGQAPIRGLKGGHLQAANIPITPMRKTKRKAKLPDPNVSPTPQTGEGRKRKFSGEGPSHKRSRSMV